MTSQVAIATSGETPAKKPTAVVLQNTPAGKAERDHARFDAIHRR